MRTAFIEQLIVEARSNPRIFLVVGDLGFSVVEPFALEFPDRFLNAGVAEQNMTGVAAGLASEGFHVFTYSIANFPTLRCLEQIRNDVCYHKLPVTIVAVGAGLAYGNLGYSHHAVQDIACLRGMPHLTLLNPADPGETRACLRHLITNPGPSYLRLGKAGEAELHPEKPLAEEPILVAGHLGAKVAIIATGSVLSEALSATKMNEAAGGEPIAVYSMPWISRKTVSLFAGNNKHEWVVCLEEHGIAGGLFELIASECAGKARVVSLATSEETISVVGTQAYLRKEHGLDSGHILQVLQSLLKGADPLI